VLSVNEAMADPADKFVIVVLDATRLFVKAEAVPDLKVRLAKLLDENTYTFAA
jgi:hypothetical protein